MTSTIQEYKEKISLTSNEEKVLRFILEETQECGYGPALEDICEEFSQTKPQVKGVLGSLTAKKAVGPFEETGFPTLYNSLNII